MLSAIKSITNDNFVFQQDSALAHFARSTVQLLQHETHYFLFPELYSPDLHQFRAEPH